MRQKVSVSAALKPERTTPQLQERQREAPSSGVPPFTRMVTMIYSVSRSEALRKALRVKDAANADRTPGCAKFMTWAVQPGTQAKACATDPSRLKLN